MLQIKILIFWFEESDIHLKWTVLSMNFSNWYIFMTDIDLTESWKSLKSRTTALCRTPSDYVV